ncbi:phage head spike fiber domain-containing protein [Salmonirosea aquatica]|uniref:Uncharacterized protein n=1 Tax=Salmonirosea aquatica TaxID=2654236 RepID=A0A7C9BL77_9BACT|nr:hypothetical protein [Cytophagaceae bacterium SJW1-29]
MSIRKIEVQTVGTVQVPATPTGPRGPKGWTPVFLSLNDGARRLVRITGWTGGVAPVPATGFLGPAGLTDTLADATDFAPRGLLSVAQDPDANLVLHYNDGTSQTIPAYFADVLAKAAEVDADAIAVELTRQFLVQLRDALVVTAGEVDADAQAVELTRQFLVNLQTALNATAAEVDADAIAVELTRQFLVQLRDALVVTAGEVDADAQAVELTRQFLVNLQTALNATASEVDADAQAVELTRQFLVALQEAVNLTAALIGDTQNSINGTATQIEAKRVEVNNLTNQAAAIVFNGSTDWPTVPPLSSWHCDSGELDPRLELAFTGNLTTCDRRGILRSAPQAARALHYDALTGKCLGLPVWPSSENVLLRSGNLSVSPWVVTGAGAVAQQADGYLITLDNTQADILFSQTSAIPAAGETWTGSIVLKAGSIADIGKEVVLQLRRVGGTYIQSSVSIVLAEEYQTVSVKVTLGSDNTGGLRYCIVKAGSNPAAAIIAKMPGLEKKTLRTPHIPTADVPASRGNASVYMLGRAFESVYDKREWTQVIECDMLEAGGVEDFLYNTTGAPNSVYSIRRSANSTIVILVRSNALSGDYVLGSFPGTGILKVAARFKKGAFAASMNGGAVVSTSHNDLGTNTTAGWYGSFSGIPVQGKYLREITTYGPGITDSQLVALSRI